MIDGHRVVCLCGSTRFMTHIQRRAAAETLLGHIVVRPEVISTLGVDDVSPQEKAALDELHLAKIRLADEVVFVAPGGYMGPSTRRELAYALQLGKDVRTDHTDYIDLTTPERTAS